MNYANCKAFHDKRRTKANIWRRYSHNQWIGYDVYSNSYMHKHHHTVTVLIHPDDTYTVNTGGWDTTTTWKKINDLISLHWRRPPPHAQGRRFLSTMDGKLTPFYDGIKVDRFGIVVSEPHPWMKRVVRKEVVKDFTALRKRVMAKIPGIDMRMLLGEFDNGEGRLLDGHGLLCLLAKIDEAESREEVMKLDIRSLFTPRPKKIFGRDRGAWSRMLQEPNQRPARARLETSFGVARRLYYIQNFGFEMVEVRE